MRIYTVCMVYTNEQINKYFIECELSNCKWTKYKGAIQGAHTFQCENAHQDADQLCALPLFGR